jgi:uncharacterized damage-inducible protein DinB
MPWSFFQPTLHAGGVTLGTTVREPIDLGEALARSFETNARITEFLVEHLPDAVWREAPDGYEGRCVAEIVAHIHNVRRMWLKPLASRAGASLPAQAERTTLSRDGALKLLAESTSALGQVVRFGVQNQGKVPGFPPDVAHFVGYLIAHEAHHRGQICFLARRLGHRIPEDVSFGMWDWSKRAKEVR